MKMVVNMRTVQITIDDGLMKEVDAAAESLQTTRSAFAREAFRAALERIKERDLEKKHREGYRRKPVSHGEFETWEREQAWGEA